MRNQENLSPHKYSVMTMKGPFSNQSEIYLTITESLTNKKGCASMSNNL
jgi:hypothetical protein